MIPTVIQYSSNMKTNPYHLGPVISRAVKCISVAFALTATTSAFAATIGEVKVNLGGNVISVGKNNALKLYSNNEIVASPFYKYDLNPTFIGKSKRFAKWHPVETQLSAFLENLKPGSSKFLNGTVSNPGGKLPFTLFDKKITGWITLKEGSPVKQNVPVKLNVFVKAEILATGKCVLDIKITTNPKRDLGIIRILGGSKLTVSSAPAITFRRTSISVAETQSYVDVPVWRLGNKRSSCSVNYQTVTGTAGGLDFESSNGTATFAYGDRTEFIRIKLVKPPTVDGKRSFTIKLSDPGGGAVLGDVTVIEIKIKDS